MRPLSRKKKALLVMKMMTLLLMLKRRRRRYQRQPRRWWVRPVFAARKQEGLYYTAGTFSVVLMAVVDSDCKYTLIDVGAEGRLGDGSTFKNSEFGRALTQGALDIPSLNWLPGSATNAPYAFIGDEAFQLRDDFLRPYPARQLDDERRVFNYRLSRARRCAENAFGITAARWRILLRTIHLKPKNVDFVIKAACILHNFLTVHNPQSHKFTDTEDSFGNLVAGQWRQGVQQASGNNSEPHFFPIKATHCRNYLGNAAAARNLFAA
ncbi:uncharacterized protein [Dermacentor albipictus]|uniref:uncharacterized protein isoform X2 n=1 Tax=Dermacentor albipictus TaxID=60249 RepID=UPI0038FD0ED2